MNFRRLGENSKISKMTETKIRLNNYSKLLLELRQHINETQKNITRQKVVMAWQIGKSINEHLAQNNQSGYGESLFKQLESDIGITQTVLYRMHSFYETYPKIPKDDDKLNWSHYRILIGIKKDDERKYLENLTRENEWGSNVLQAQVKKSKISQIREVSARRVQPANPKKLVPKRGRIFCYNLIKRKGEEKIYIDCGFDFFLEAEELLPKQLKVGDQIVESTKEGEDYSFTKVASGGRKINIYKAALERVVDGDTLHVILDLGFKTSHRDILRLRGVNAPEMSSAAGKKSATALKRILKKVPFLVIKTTSTDVYGRYVADVFLAHKSQENDPQKVADEGIYLNQLLLDKGVVEAFSS